MEYRIADHLSGDEIKHWDQFVEEARFSHAFQRTDWGEFEKSYAGRTPLYCIGTEKGQIRLAALILEKKTRRGGLALHEIPCGPAFSDPEHLDTFLRFIDGVFSQRSIQLEIWPRVPEPVPAGFQKIVEAQGFKAMPDIKRVHYHDQTVVVDLKPEPDAIIASFRKNNRGEIRREERAGVHVTVSNSDEAMAQFYTLYKLHATQRKVLPLEKKYFTTLHKTFLHNPRNGFIAVGFHEKTPLSAAVYLRNGETVWFTYGASNVAAKEKMSTSHLMHWKAMMHAKDAGCTRYDFGGSLEQTPGPEDPLHGIVSFKRGFSKDYIKYSPAYAKTYKPLMVPLLKLYRSGKAMQRTLLGIGHALKYGKKAKESL